MENILSELGVGQEKIDEFFYLLKDNELSEGEQENRNKSGESQLDNQISKLKMEILGNQDDWRKRASLAAEIISRSLE